MPLTTGTRLGQYEIVGTLGVGGMGEVYRAKDLRLGRVIALKVVPETFAHDANYLVRFECEARMIARLNHPNIVTLHSVEEEAGTHFLTMELVEGQRLTDLVTTGGLPVARVLDIAIAIADALTAAHENGVVHRDLKPANVMVSSEGRLKVLDFGLAKLTPATTLAETETMTTWSPRSERGVVMGTVPYMAPEQIRAETVDARTDLFAFGIMLYELLAGHRPFAGSTALAMSAAILNEAPEPLTRVRTDLPSDLERIVSRCLEKNPRERAQSALDISNDLRRLRRMLERGERESSAPEKIASIAVLPFVNRSRDEEDEYFSDGLADELLNMLAKIRGLRVASRSSAFHFKGKDTTIAEIGHVLNVATVLEGSVRKDGQRVRISVQLVKVADGYHLWSETYDRTLQDIFAVQDDIAQSVVNELRTTLLGEEEDPNAAGELKAEVSKAAKGRGTNAEAHRLFLQARHLVERVTREDVTKGIEYLKQALELDPEFALAWSDLGWANSRAADFGWSPVGEGYARARESVQRALLLEPDLAEAHGTMGTIRMSADWDWRGAEASFRRALELAPGNAVVLRSAAMLAVNRGRIEDGIKLLRRSLQQDPLSAICYKDLGLVLRTADRLTEAEEAYRKSLELAPHRSFTRAHLAQTLLAQGRGDEALAIAVKEPNEGMRLYALAIVQHAQRCQAESDRTLGELIEKYAESFAYQIAQVCAMRGDRNAAFDWLERAHALRDPGLSGSSHDANFRSLHGDPRWSAFMMKMGFEM